MVANGYQIQCRAILGHFESRINRIVKGSLESYSSQGRSRKDLIAISDRCVEEVDSELAVEDYHDAIDERAFESPFDPDFESKQYYEHENRLEIDEGYAEMIRHNAKIQKDATRRKRQKDKAEWVSLFKTARDLASTFYTSPKASYPWYIKSRRLEYLQQRETADNAYLLRKGLEKRKVRLTPYLYRNQISFNPRSIGTTEEYGIFYVFPLIAIQ